MLKKLLRLLILLGIAFGISYFVNKEWTMNLVDSIKSKLPWQKEEILVVPAEEVTVSGEVISGELLSEEVFSGSIISENIAENEATGDTISVTVPVQTSPPPSTPKAKTTTTTPTPKKTSNGNLLNALFE